MSLSACGPAAVPSGTPSVPAPTGTPATSPAPATPAQPPPGPQTNPVDRAAVQDGGTFQLGVAALPSSWNPWGLSAFDLNPVIDAMTPRLFDVAADGSLTWDPAWLAAAPQVGYGNLPPGTAMTVTYDLNPDARWSDGAPIALADFQATAEACRTDPGPVCQDRGFDHVTDVSAGTDAHQVVVSYDADYPDWQYTYARGPSRAESIATAQERSASWATPVGHDGAFSGPYRVSSASGTSVALTRNPLWWGAPAKLDTITVSVPDPDSVVLAFWRQDLDALWTIDPNVLSSLSGVSGLDVRRGTGRSARFVLMNCGEGPLADPAVRQAVQLGLDRRTLADSDLAGLKEGGEDLNSPLWMPGQPGYEDLTQATGVRPPDPKAAAALLDEAGWTMGSDGIRSRDSVALAWDFLVPRGDAQAENEGFGLAAQLKGLGIRLSLVYADPDQVSESLQTGAYAMAAVTIDYTTDLAAAARYTTGHLAGYSQAVVDLAYHTALSTADPVLQTGLLNGIAQAVWSDVPVLPLYVVPQILVTRSGLANYGPDGLGTVIWENVGWAA